MYDLERSRVRDMNWDEVYKKKKDCYSESVEIPKKKRPDQEKKRIGIKHMKL